MQGDPHGRTEQLVTPVGCTVRSLQIRDRQRAEGGAKGAHSHEANLRNQVHIHITKLRLHHGVRIVRLDSIDFVCIIHYHTYYEMVPCTVIRIGVHHNYTR